MTTITGDKTRLIGTRRHLYLIPRTFYERPLGKECVERRVLVGREPKQLGGRGMAGSPLSLSLAGSRNRY